MLDDDRNPIKQVHEHIYNLPKIDPSQVPDSYRQVSIVTLNGAVHLISSHKEETMDFLCKKAIQLMDKYKE